MLKLSHMSTRNELGKYLNSLNLLGIAAEIGTHRGVFSRTLLDNWEGDKLYCIDPWSTPPGYEYQHRILVSELSGSKNRSKDMLAARSRMDNGGHRGRYEIIQSTSKQSYDKFSDNTLDFVYLDGDHRYEYVRYDISAWFLKTKVGGVLAGHDFVTPGCDRDDNPNWGEGIQKALLDTGIHTRYDVYIIAEENNLPWTWYIVK